jgi:glucose/arabinose dehydrogenase
MAANLFPHKKTSMKTLSISTSLLTLLLISLSCKKNSNKPPKEDADWPKDSIRVVVSQGISHPWEILWGPDNHIWMTERNGRVSRVDPKTGTVKPLLTIEEVEANGEGGLLGMVLHPDFAQTPDVYVVYNYNSSNGYREKVVRYRYANNALGSPAVIIDNIPAAGIHNGSRLLISPDRKLFITTGDAANSGNAQVTGSPSGKVLRLNLDGSIPADNPYPNNPAWSIGHRNPQGLVYANGILYASEHGAGIEDEVNIIEKQRNYGWPTVEGPCSGGETVFCTANNVKEPIWSTGNGTFALCGLDYYNSDRISQWKHSLLLLSLKNATLHQLKLSADGKTVTSTKNYFSGDFGRLRDLCISPAGRVYICTDENNGKLIEISIPE